MSIPKDIAPAAITLPEAEELILSKRDAESKKVVKTFDNDADMMILNGRYGIYICYKKSNYKIPRTVKDPSNLSYDECLEIVSSQDDKPKKKTTRRTTKTTKK